MKMAVFLAEVGVGRTSSTCILLDVQLSESLGVIGGSPNFKARTSLVGLCTTDPFVNGPDVLRIWTIDVVTVVAREQLSAWASGRRVL